MTRLAQTADLTDIQREILSTVRSFVDKEIIPHAQELEHGDIYPQEIVDGLKELGIFGLTIPEEFGGLGESLLTYALVVEEIARGWMSVSGVINTHFIVAYMIIQHGTQEQKERFLPRMATGEVRGAFSMSEPGLGLRRRRHPHQGDQAGRRRLRHRRPEDVADQRRQLHAGRRAGPHRRGRREGPPEPDDVPGREAGRLRRGASRAHHPREDRQDGLQGRRHHRAGVRRLPGHGRRRPRRRARPRLLADDGRRRGRPGQRRRPRLRHLHPRLRAGHRLRPAARDLRQADRPAPGDRLPARRDGDQGRGRAR